MLIEGVYYRDTVRLHSAHEGKEAQLGLEESTRRIPCSLHLRAKMQCGGDHICNAQGSLFETQRLGSLLGLVA